MSRRQEIQSIGTPLTAEELRLARHFWHVQFNDREVEGILHSGYRIFIQYELDNALQWTYSQTFHSTYEMAYLECLEIRREGIIDIVDGVQRFPEIKRIVIQPFPTE